nr:MAG TPA: Prohead core protein serine protease [Caudoviricetes sp.]
MSKIGYILNESSVCMENVDIREDKNDRTRVTGMGILQTGNEKNRNGRIYRTADLAKEIAAPRQQELLAAKQMCGEAGHPIGADASSLVRQQTIDPTKICVRYLKLWMEGDNVMGTFQGTNNALGEAFDKDLRQGVLPAFSLRALGTISSTPQGAVVENLKMITYDYVIYPSHPHAYTKGVINESAGIASAVKSNFTMNSSMDGTRSFIKEFSNKDVVNAITSMRESAVDYIKDKSHNFKLLQECYDMTNYDTIDIISPHKIALTEAGKNTIIMNVEDYIANEIQNYV